MSHSLEVTAMFLPTSDTRRLFSLLSLVRFAEVLKMLAMPMSDRRVCREYDCTMLNLGRLISTLL